jgi:hypothetical protein
MFGQSSACASMCSIHTIRMSRPGPLKSPLYLFMYRRSELSIRHAQHAQKGSSFFFFIVSHQHLILPWTPVWVTGRTAFACWNSAGRLGIA